MRSVICLFLLLGLITTSNSQTLSDKSEIAIVTLGAFQPELYSAFGHSAIRVYDPNLDLDWAFNYGVFDFEQENFYLNFAKGKMVYQLGLAYYQPFKNNYVNQDRDVREQYLNLTLEEKQEFLDFLMTNRRPENREYFYNYVYDNCASKIPDVLESIFPQAIAYETDFMIQDKTIRDLMHDYLEFQPWGQWMIDIGLGTQIDKGANKKEYMFLPDYVFESLKDATIATDNETKKLVQRTEIIHRKQKSPTQGSGLTPMNVFILIFFIGGLLTQRNMKKQRRTKWLDGLLFGFSGMVGCWLVFLWAGTAHLSTWNLDLLWAIPFHLPIVFMIRKNKWEKWIRVYFKFTAIWYGVLLLVWAILPEPLHMALVPFTLLLLLRAAYISYDLKAIISEIKSQ